VIESYRTVDLIERAHDAERYCSCGRHTTVVEHDGQVWLECSSHDQRPASRVARALAALGAGLHTRRVIVDLRPLVA
jgi:hypothetical protein